MIRIGIVGGGGLVAGEIMRIIYNHPKCELTYVASSTFENKPIDSFHPALKNKFKDKTFSKYSPEEIKDNCDVIFICRSHGESSAIVKDLFNFNIKIIDLGADFRLKEIENFNTWYHGAIHSCPELLSSAIYGLSEINYEKIKNAKLIANPGCYATSIILGAAPLFADKLINMKEVSITSCSGISGAGREYKSNFNMFIDVYNNVKPYKIGSHAHIGEIEQMFKNFHPASGPITFIPQVIPTERGIMSTLTFTINDGITENKIHECYKNFYKKSNFIRLFTDKICEMKNVIGTNYCDITPIIDKHSNKLIVFSTIDNLIKGAAGQAIQNMNIAMDLPETTGLTL